MQKKEKTIAPYPLTSLNIPPSSLQNFYDLLWTELKKEGDYVQQSSKCTAQDTGLYRTVPAVPESTGRFSRKREIRPVQKLKGKIEERHDLNKPSVASCHHIDIAD